MILKLIPRHKQKLGAEKTIQFWVSKNILTYICIILHFQISQSFFKRVLEIKEATKDQKCGTFIIAKFEFKCFVIGTKELCFHCIPTCIFMRFFTFKAKDQSMIPINFFQILPPSLMRKHPSKLHGKLSVKILLYLLHAALGWNQKILLHLKFQLQAEKSLGLEHVSEIGSAGLNLCP